MDNAIIKTYGKFVNQLEDHKVADAKQIYDEEYIGVFPKSGATKGWYQNDINKHIVTNIEALDTELATKIASVKSGLDGDLEKEVAARKAADDKINDTLDMITDGNYVPTFGGANIGGDVEIGVPASLYYSSDIYSQTYTTGAEIGQHAGWIKFPAGWFHHLVVSDNEFNAKTIIDPRSITFSAADDDLTTEGRMYAYNGHLILSPYDDGAYDGTLNPDGGIAVSNLASKEYVENKIKSIKIDTTGLASTSYVDSKISDVDSKISDVDSKITALSGKEVDTSALATTTYVDNKFKEAIQYTEASADGITRQLSDSITEVENKIPDVTALTSDVSNIKKEQAEINAKVSESDIVAIPDSWGNGISKSIYNSLDDKKRIRISINFNIVTVSVNSGSTTSGTNTTQKLITTLLMCPVNVDSDSRDYTAFVMLSSHPLLVSVTINNDYTVSASAIEVTQKTNSFVSASATTGTDGSKDDAGSVISNGSVAE